MQIGKVAVLIITPLPAPFPSVATHRERVQARPNKPRSQVVTWMSVHMPMQRTYEGLQQRVINNLDIPILALCGLVAIKAQVSPRESAQRGQGLTKASGSAHPATTHPHSEFLCVMVLVKPKINGGD